MYTFFFEKLIGVPTFSQVWLPWLVPFSLLAGHTIVTRTPRLRPVNAVNAILRWIAFRLVVHRIWLRKTLLPAVNIAALKVNIAQPPSIGVFCFCFCRCWRERSSLSYIYFPVFFFLTFSPPPPPPIFKYKYFLTILLRLHLFRLRHLLSLYSNPRLYRAALQRSSRGL